MWKYARLMLLLIIGISVVNADARSRGPGTKVSLEVIDYRNCPEMDNLLMNVYNPVFEMEPDNDTMYLSGNFCLSTSLDDDTINIISIRRCANEMENSCEKYLDYDANKMCAYLEKDGTTISDFCDNMEGFVRKCPLKPGCYPINEAPVNPTGLFPKNGLVAGLWRLRYVAKVNNRIVGCTSLLAEVKVKRVVM